MVLRGVPWLGMRSRYRVLGAVALASLLLAVYNVSALMLWLGWASVEKISGLSVESEWNKGYLVRTEGCSMPEYDVRDPSIAIYLSKPETVDCNPHGLPPLTYTVGPYVHVDLNPLVLARYHVTQNTLSCCYKEITRVTESLENHSEECDNKFKLSACVPIDVKTGVSPTVTTDGVLVICFFQGNPKKTVYKNVHYFFQHNKVKKKIDASKKNHGSDSKPLNFIFVGIDSVSRQNMRRFMPETFRYVTRDLMALDFMGYNKVADNTDPNLTPILTGLKAEHFDSYNNSCYRFQKDNLDECPFIWKNFSSKGYVTVYAEDAPNMGLYHFHKIGFVQEPTDFYIRPHFMVSEKEIGHIGTDPRCQGLRQSPEVIYDYTLQALNSFQKVAPVFGYFWTASYTHGKNEFAAALDLTTATFFRKFVENGYNNNTVVFFISDHGMRFGDIRSTYLGALEERLPFVMMLFPPWFRKAYPDTWQNLETNRRRLINNYDLHLTMVDILGGFYTESNNPHTYFGFGQSLFLEVPQTRTCESCGIPSHYCACQTSSNINTTDKTVIEGANFIVKNLNHGISKNLRCAHLDLKRVVRARVAQHEHNLQETMQKKSVTIWRTYTVVLETTPGGGQFEGTLVQGAKGWELAGGVSRINLYGRQSHCVEDVLLKKYCYCLEDDTVTQDT